jgi:hypothetical protein
MKDKTGRLIAAFIIVAVAWTSGSPDASMIHFARVP